LKAGSDGAAAGSEGGGGAGEGSLCGETLEDESEGGGAVTAGGEAILTDVSWLKGIGGDGGEKLGKSAAMGGGGDGILK
ncbi:MAG: PE family protein, partial [Nitrospirota bacterium]|nr:PE family protein [Nitrospirota bacterium]